MSMPFPIASDEDFKRLVENPLFHQLLDALSIGVSLTDPTGTVRYFSQSCYHIYGLDPSESVVGKKIDAIFQTGRAGVLNSLQTRRINTVNSISYNGVEGLCRRCPILDDKGNLVCCLSEVIVTTHDNERIEELLHNLQQLKRKVGYFIAQETTGGGLRTFDDLVGDTSVMQALKAMGKRFARSREPVLILGESGTGKELFAQAIHKASPRANGSFISVNCAALPRELAESELFGYVEGAFTGARKGGQKGKFELADKGTIFLDEIGELPLYLQAKLLRVLESNEIQKIGMSGSKYSDFRLIAATNRNLPELVDKRQFREDLYHRLNILELNLPPLRKHRGDIPSLITQLIEGICGPQKALEIRISQDVLDLFMRYGWPGNVRELKNVLAYAYCCMDDDAVELTPRYLPERLFMGSRSEDVPAAEEPGAFLFHGQCQREAEKKGPLAIPALVAGGAATKSKAAKLLGFSRNTLYLKMKALGMGLQKEIDVKRPRDPSLSAYPVHETVRICLYKNAVETMSEWPEAWEIGHDQSEEANASSLSALGLPYMAVQPPSMWMTCPVI